MDGDELVKEVNLNSDLYSLKTCGFESRVNVACSEYQTTGLEFKAELETKTFELNVAAKEFIPKCIK